MSDSAADPIASPATHAPDTTPIWSATEGQVVNLGYFALCLAFCWLLVPIIVAMVVRYLRTALHCYELTGQRLRERTGILNRQTEELELYRVKDMAIEQPLAQRLFGRGRIVLQTSDRSTPLVVLNGIAAPREVAQLLREHVEQCRATKGVREID
jgi:uncharacterized membrane protein YdbT with pleckstrin-like domain